MPAPLRVRDRHHCWGGVQGFFEHDSLVCHGPMRFAVYLPPDVTAPVRAVLVLSGLTCTDENFALKAGAQRTAALHNLALIMPDTSPRVVRVPGDDLTPELGLGAGFYVDATEAPWAPTYQLETWIFDELLPFISQHFPITTARIGVMGHSMGGHGALTFALRHPDRFTSVSALAPVAAPTQTPLGRQAFVAYLGPDETRWRHHDATALVAAGHRFPAPPLIDQGLDDPYRHKSLRPDLLEAACIAANQPLTLRWHPGYDHSYWFVQSFVADHLEHHARALAIDAGS